MADKKSSQSHGKVRFFYGFSQFVARSFFKLFFGLKIYGLENIPQAGAFILASNHQSNFDPPIVGSTCNREVAFAAKKELFEFAPLGKLISYYNAVPVRRTGYDRRMLTILMKVLKDGRGVNIYPEGTRYLDGKLHYPRAGVGMLAVRTNAPILPVYVSGSNRLWSQLLRRKLTVTFGKTFNIDPDLTSKYSVKDSYKVASEVIIKEIAKVGKSSPPELKWID